MNSRKTFRKKTNRSLHNFVELAVDFMRNFIMNRPDGLIQRRNVNKENDEEVNSDVRPSPEDDASDDGKETRLTLMEEILLLGLKDKEVKLH